MELLQKFQANISDIELAYNQCMAPGQNDLDLNTEFPQFIKLCEGTVNENLVNLEQYVLSSAFHEGVQLEEFYDMLLNYARAQQGQPGGFGGPQGS